MIPKFLSQEQIEYIKQNFAHTPNLELVEIMGISEASIHRVARHFGLTKSEEGMRNSRAYAVKKILATKRRNGTFPPKGYVIPKREQHYFKKGHNIWERIGPERAKEAHRKIGETRTANRLEDKVRIMLCEPRQTKYKIGRQHKKLVSLRSRLRKRGYYADSHSCNVYYDEYTKRSNIIESTSTIVRFAPLSELDESLRHTYRNRVIKCKKTTTPCQTESKQ